MSESHKPRENDHLVEPLYDSLRELEGEEGLEPSQSKKGALIRMAVLVLVVGWVSAKLLGKI
ncbi:MAG: hypothetical protein ACI8X5_000246 [Planctomycetota bacterium]|jgi:hypothetical protein